MRSWWWRERVVRPGLLSFGVPIDIDLASITPSNDDMLSVQQGEDCMHLRSMCWRLPLVAALAGLAFWLVLPSPSYAQTHGCSCVHNETGQQVNFRYHFGDGNWKVVNLQPRYNDAICWRYTDPTRSSPPLQFQIDVDMTNGNAWKVYTLIRVQTQGSTCAVVPQNGQYTIKYRPGTNNQFVEIYKKNP
jgi:hypothetical protein